MLPFIVALIFAVGLPLLPSSVHRALHLPTLNLNFLSARRTPEQVLVSSPETTLLLESSYSEISPDSGGSSQYLVFPNISSADCQNNAGGASACISLTENPDYPQSSSIWSAIHTQLLYQLVEATIIIALSFFVTATFLPRRCLSTFLERLCTALFISRHYSPKAALSSFLQDVFYGLHQFWMDDNIAKGEARNSAAENSRQVALQVFANVISLESCETDKFLPSVASVSVIQDLVPLEKASLCSGTSSSNLSLSRITPPIDAARTPSLDTSTHSLGAEADVSEEERPQDTLGTPVKHYPSCTTQPTIINETHSLSGISPLRTVEVQRPSSNTSFPVVSSPLNNSTASLPSISMEDLYNSTRLSTTQVPVSEPLRKAQEANAPDPSPYFHESLTVTTPNLESKRFQSESTRASFTGIPQGNRRRYNSDGIQARADCCHPGDAAASPPGSLPALRIRRNTSEQAESSHVSVYAALTGVVVTPEGELIVPASQRPDGSMRKEIRLRPGHSLREPFAEKYRPPAARRRTSTWDPHLRGYLESPPLSLHLHDAPLPSTPKGTRQRLVVRHSNSPAYLIDNWRRSNSTVETPPATAVMIPSMEEAKSSSAAVQTRERNSPPETSPSEYSAPSRPEVITSAPPIVDKVPMSNQDTPPLSLIPEKEMTEGAEVTRAGSSASLADDGLDGQENQPPEVSSPTRMEEEVRRPLRDITVSFSAPRPKAVGYLALQATTTPTPTILSQGTDAHTWITNVFSGKSRETTLLRSPRKRKPSAEPELFQPSDSSPTPHRHPRARRSAPHLGRYYADKQQVKAPRTVQTPEGPKRRRMRTTSSRGVENWTVTLATRAIDQSGQIVLPAGTGWKGRSLAVGQPPLPQRQG